MDSESNKASEAEPSRLAKNGLALAISSRVKVFLLCIFSKYVFADTLHIPLNQNEVLHLPKVQKIAISNSKILKTRWISPQELLLTGIAPGQSTLRLWDKKSLKTIEVVVLSNEETKILNDASPLVKVEMEFIELNQIWSKSLGVKWPESTALQFAPSETTGLNYSFAFPSAQIFIQHLIKEGMAKSLAQPQLQVRLGEEAVFHSGGELPITQGSQNFGNVYKQVQWKPYGLTVKVKPKSIDYFQIFSDVQMELSELNAAQSVEGIPGMTRRKIDTKIQAKEGQTLLISGLKKQSQTKSSQGVPGLEQLPLLGFIFQSKQEQREETEVWLSITFTFSKDGKDI